MCHHGHGTSPGGLKAFKSLGFRVDGERLGLCTCRYIYIFRERERDIYILVYKFIKDVVKYFGLDSFLIDVLSIPSFGPAM